AEHRGYVELRVVGEDADRIARTERRPDTVEHPVRPVDDDLVGHREPSRRGEHLARVADDHPVAEDLRDATEGRGEVDRAEDEHLRRWRERLDEEADRGLVRLALLAVVAHPRAARFELGERIAGRDPIEVGVAESAERRLLGTDEQVRAEVRAIDHRDEGDGLLREERLAQDLVDRWHSAYQSSGSMKRWMMPPHVRPTANASSSL